MAAPHATYGAAVVPIVLFVATFIRSTFGFGEALVSVPILALLVLVRIVTPLAVLASITVAVIVVAEDLKHVHVRSAGWLVISSLLGIPLGLWLLKVSLAVVILAFSIYSLRRQECGVRPGRRQGRGY